MIRRYGVLHAGGGPTGEDIALPAQFLIARDRTIRWRHVSQRVQQRMDPAAIMAEVEKLRD